MKTWLIAVQGAGEYSLTLPVIEYVQSQGDRVVTFIDLELIHRGIVTQDVLDSTVATIYDRQRENPIEKLAGLIKLLEPDILLMNPSRGWHVSIPASVVEKVKVKATLEANVQFKGIGNSHVLDTIEPSWLDHYFVASDERWFRETLKNHYGVGTLPSTLQNKVHATGWFGKKLDRKEQDYVLVYTGGGLTQNDGYLQDIMDNLPKGEKVIAISNDVVVGNFPNLQRFSAVNDFDGLLAGCKYFIGHEALGTINKCIINGIPFISIRRDNRLKFAETEASNKLKYGRVITQKEITADTLKPIAAHTGESGVEELYKIIVKSL